MKTYGLIGYPVKHSLSALMHNAAFKELAIEAQYQLFEIEPENLEGFILKRVSSEGICGFNVTVPYKIKAKEILDGKFKIFQACDTILTGAINTVKIVSSEVEYRNTDVIGFSSSLKKDLGFDQKDKDVFIFGCGGAGRAVIAGLLGSSGADAAKKIYIFEANLEAREAAKQHFYRLGDFREKNFLKDRLEFVSIGQISNTIKKCSLLVNASPVGMHKGDPSPIGKSLLRKDLAIFDVIYNQPTQLVAEAKKIGAKVSNGLGMLLYQGVAAFEFWTGNSAPVEVMRQALENGLNKKA